ncbi:hypothetical protein MKX01_041570 [Papaver californicum]|nr:hypothetical protein MKX01_041570 [Papaver californicum]
MANTNGQVIKCKVAVAWKAGKPLVIEEVEVAPPKEMEVRIKILFTALCHTDVYFWETKGQTPMFPHIFGHESEGIVESVDQGVTDFQPGDHVLPIFIGECKECRHCKSEESNMCDLLRINTDKGVMLNDGKSRFSINGKPIYNFVGCSTFSEYTVVHVGCLGAALNVAKPKKGSTIAVFGLGAVGLARVIRVDLNANRFKEAKKFGCTEFVNPKDHSKPVQKVIAAMNDGGVDRNIECTGSIQAMICIRMLFKYFLCGGQGWGVPVLVGVPNKDDAFQTHPVNLLSERTLKGTLFGNYNPRSDLPSVIEIHNDINKAFDIMLKGEGIRCIIRME